MVNTCQKNSSLKECGIKSELTAAYSPQQNGVSEQLNRTLVEAARSMLSHADLSSSYWAEAVATATFLCNRMVSVTRLVGIMLQISIIILFRISLRNSSLCSFLFFLCF